MSEQSENHERVVGLLVRHQDQLYRYIFALLHDAADAWDVLQEASIAIVRKATEYDAERPFLPWAYRFAFLTTIDWRKKKRREAASLSDDVLKVLAAERLQQEEELMSRLSALEHCLEELPLKQRDLVRQRYESRETMKEIASLQEVSLRTLYRRLDSIRRWLHDCIDRRLATEGI
jgi:RNA polymerase sigma-70 factor (ECF subfamily)